jgi:hypothetical protein
MLSVKAPPNWRSFSVILSQKPEISYNSNSSVLAFATFGDVTQIEEIRYFWGDNLKVAWTEFSTLSWTVLVQRNLTA